MDRCEVVVVGAGVMGTAAARALARRGVDAVLLEQFELGHTRGSSHGPTRIFRIAYPDPMYSRMSQRALELWRQLEQDAGETLLVTTGGIDAGPVAHLCGQALETVGAPFEWLTPEQAATRFSSVSFDGLHPILFQPDAGVCLADRTVLAQARLASDGGIDVREHTEVLAIEPRDGRVLVRTESDTRTGGGTLEARVAVVTAGSWASELLAGLGRASPLTPILQTVTYFPPRDAGAPSVPTFIEWGSPELIWYALGSGGEAPGVKLGQHVGGVPADPRDGPFSPSQDLIRSQRDYIARRFPGLEPEPVRADTCLYTMTPDEDFVLDRVGPVVVGAGFSGHGFKFGPLIGEILADLALGGNPGLDLSRFRLDRPALLAAS